MDKEYHDLLNQTLQKSNEIFEKRLLLVITGGMSILITLHTQVNTHSHIWMFFVSAALFVLSLFVNLLSHLYVSHLVEKILSRKTSAKVKSITKQNLMINRINNFSVVTLMFAILFAFAYIGVN